MKLEGLKNLKDFQKIAITVWSITAFFSGDGGKNFTKQQKHNGQTSEVNWTKTITKTKSTSDHFKAIVGKEPQEIK